MPISGKRSVLVVTLIAVAILGVLTMFLFMLSNNSRNLREEFLLKDALKMTSIAFDLELNSHSDLNESETDHMLNNINSLSGEPLLSWRVRLLRHNPDTQVLYDQFEKNANWNAPTNFSLIETKPPWYYYPYYLDDNEKSCVVGIEEIMSLDKSKTIQDAFQKKAIIVVIEPEHAVDWTEPRDISWKDLAKGAIKPFKNNDGYISYIKLGDCTFEKRPIPRSALEWQELCGITEEERVKLESLKNTGTNSL